jgi:eukaryotic-like serine/threonine-protein kinase
VDTALADPLAGTTLDGRYRIDARIARGGMSTVYSALDLRLDRRVAVKVMSPALAGDPAFVERFGREARAAARLSHPNAVAVFDQGTSDSRSGPVVFLVMELVTGHTLRDLLRERGRLGADEAVSLLEPVLAALAAAHRAGLVHRDVKPENVLLSDDGVVKVADFGLARAVAAPSAATLAGTFLGTVAYIAPEQVARGTADPRTDVYAAGIVLYEMLTGAPPFDGDSAISVAYRHVHDDVPAPSTVVPSIPPALDELVLRATRREPGARPADAGAFLAELADVRSDAGLRRVPVPVRWAGHRLATGVGIPTVAAGGAMAWPPGAAIPRTTAMLPAYQTVAPARGGPPAGRRGGPRPRDEQRAHRRRFAIGVVCVLLLGLLAALAGWYYGSGRFVDVPSLTRLTQQQAAAQARASGFDVRTGGGVYSESVPAGRVVRTDPAAGDRAPRGSTLLLIPSRGPAPVDVPNVVGKSREEGEGRIGEAGLRSQVREEFSTEAEAGTVISQDPSGGQLRRGGTVTLVVSKGADLVQVPRVEGRSEKDASKRLTRAGFEVKVTKFFGGAPLGRVWQQSPAAGRRVPRGSTVTIYVL